MTQLAKQREATIRDLSVVMNKHGIDTRLDIPDFIIAELVFRQIASLVDAKDKTNRWKRLTHDPRTPGRTTQEEVALGGVGTEDKGCPHRADGGSVQ